MQEEESTSFYQSNVVGVHRKGETFESLEELDRVVLDPSDSLSKKC